MGLVFHTLSLRTGQALYMFPLTSNFLDFHRMPVFLLKLESSAHDLWLLSLVFSYRSLNFQNLNPKMKHETILRHICQEI